MIFASLHDYLPLDDLLRILVACVAVAVVAPSAAALVITGFESQAAARSAGRPRAFADARIVLGVAVIAAMIAAGLFTLIDR